MPGVIVPIGSIDPVILKGLAEGLKRVFLHRVETGALLALPKEGYHPERRQYLSTQLLKETERIRKRDADWILGVTEADLFVPGLNFVFGEADPASGIAVISLARLRQEFYPGLRIRKWDTD